MAVTFPYSVLNFQNYWAAERDVIDWRFHEIWVSSEFRTSSLQWRHNESDGVPNDRRRDCLLNRLLRRRSKRTSKLHVTGLCGGIHRSSADSPHIRPVRRKMFPFDDVIMFHRTFPSATSTRLVTGAPLELIKLVQGLFWVWAQLMRGGVTM